MRQFDSCQGSITMDAFSSHFVIKIHNCLCAFGIFPEMLFLIALSGRVNFRTIDSRAMRLNLNQPQCRKRRRKTVPVFFSCALTEFCSTRTRPYTFVEATRRHRFPVGEQTSDENERIRDLKTSFNYFFAQAR